MSRAEGGAFAAGIAAALNTPVAMAAALNTPVAMAAALNTAPIVRSPDPVATLSVGAVC